MAPFPILKLPLVILEETMRILNPIELYQLSKCSKRSYKLVPLAGTKNYSLRATFSMDKLLINEKFSFITLPSLTSLLMNPDQQQTRFTWIDNNCNLDRQTRLKNLLLSLLDIFKCGIYHLETEQDHTAIQLEELFSGLQGTTIHTAVIRGADISASTLERIFGSVKYLELSLELPICDFKSFETFPSLVYIAYDNGKTRNQCTSFKSCQYLMIHNSHIDNKELNRFLESWKNGNFPRLEVAVFQSENLKKHEEIAGFSDWPRNTTGGVSKEKRTFNWTHQVQGGEEIVRNDGIKATIQLDTCFIFLVWLDL
ncbi:hypothetical protein B9Z55_003050 [Caenorhabditis nigoni]|uniref:F-box domain-containing protein n=2 Tax=Caenorhabditis nigoni TaxID=1611254 RepID=A0A2G5VN74_9PELO|nr:hypothetical protein B9Z55_003050 [Caenorhabditis nigoni]